MGRYVTLIIVLLLGGCRSTFHEEKDLVSILKQIELLNEQKKYTEAISLIKSSQPYVYLDLLEMLAFSYEANGQFLLAAQTFEQLFFADTEKKYTESAFYAAQIYTQLGCLYAASRCYRLYIDIHFKDAGLWFALSETEEALDHTSLALTAYLNGMQYCKQKTNDMLYRLTHLCYKNQMWDESVFWGKEYLKISEKNVDILQILLEVADKHNDRQEAKIYIDELLKLDASYLEKNPDISLKYTEEKIPEEIFIHEINATQEEIERTLALFQNFYKNFEIKVLQSYRHPNCLCLLYTY